MKNTPLIAILAFLLLSSTAVAQLDKKQWYNADMELITSKKERKEAAFIRQNTKAAEGLYTCKISRADGSLFQEFTVMAEPPHLKHGPFTAYYHHKKQALSETWSNGKRWGKSTSWNEAGEVTASGIYKDDLADGPWEFKNADGYFTGTMDNGKRSGWWTEVRPDRDTYQQFYSNDVALGDVQADRTTLSRVALLTNQADPRSKRLWGLINQQGIDVLPCKYDMLWWVKDTIWQAKDSTGKWGVITCHDTVLIPFQYDNLAYSQGFYRVMLDAKYGIINEQGQQVIPPIYDELRELHEGRIAARIDKNWGYLDANGKVVIEFRFKDACNFEFGTGYVLLFSGKGHRIAPDGHIEGPWQYPAEGCLPPDPVNEPVDQFAPRSIGLTASGTTIELKKKRGENNRVGMTNQNDVWVIDPHFDDIGPHSNGMIVVFRDGRWGAINDLGEYVIGFRYAVMTGFDYPSK